MASILEQDIILEAIKKLLELNYNSKVQRYFSNDGTSVIFTIKHHKLNIQISSKILLNEITIDNLSKIYDKISKELKQECIKLLKG